MGKKKTTTTQNQTSSGTQNSNFANTNTYGWQTAPDTEDTKAYREWRPQIDPGLGAQYAGAKNSLTSSFNNPLGGYATPQMRDAQQRTGLRNLNQDESLAFRGAYNDVNAQRGNQLAGLSALTHPTLTQTGSSGNSTGNYTGNMAGTGTATQSGNLLGDILGPAATVGSGSLMGKNRKP
jgi:hypothetical protein